jgi:hypothetical protein
MNLTINGRSVTVDDSFRNLSREEQDATVEEIAGSMPKPEASGVAAGMVHGASEMVNGPAETLKRFAGVGPGRKDDPNYVPANVTNGSWNPLNWSPSQLPQKVAEAIPSMMPDVASGVAGAKIGKSFGGAKGAAIGALLGAALSGTARTAGDTAKDATVARTGDANAESSTADLVRGGATAAASSLAGAALPTRFVPGLNGATKDLVGASGALDAAKRYLATTALGGAGGAGSNVITQAGLTVGTDKGLTIDPSQIPEAAVGGAATGAVAAAPRFAGDAVRAGTLSKFGGDNLEPTKNVATRLEAASQKLGSAKSDEAALGTVMSDLRNELGTASANVRKQVQQLSPDADNALVRAQRGEKITPAEVELIKQQTAAAPDGPNTAFLAHSIYAANLMAERGGHSNRGWAGGMSGIMDKNLGFLLNPARLAGGAAATALGMHLLGTSNPMFGGALAGTYGVTRAVDAMTGMRSPAKTFVEHFADQNAKLRMPTAAPQGPAAAPQPQQAPAPGPIPRGPWNPAPPAPAYGPTGTVTGTRPAPQAPQAPAAPQLNPIALAMLKKNLQQGLPQAPQAPAAPAAPEPINPLMMPRDITTPAKNLMAGFKNTGKMENTYNTETRKAEGVAQAEALAAQSPTILEQGGLEGLISPEATKHGSSLLATANLMRRLADASPGEKAAAKEEATQAKAQASEEKAAAREEKAQAKAEARAETAKAKEATKLANAQLKAKASAEAAAAKAQAAAAALAAKAPRPAASLNSAATPLSIAQILHNVTAEVTAPKKIKKANGKVETQEAPAPKVKAAFEPFEEHEMVHPNGVTAKEYAATEKANYGATSPKYERDAAKTAQRRIDAKDRLTQAYPAYRRSFEGLLRQLHEIGTNADKRAAAVEHYASHVPDDVGNAMREAFK